MVDLDGILRGDGEKLSEGELRQTGNVGGMGG
jgi:hypothetical protein